MNITTTQEMRLAGPGSIRLQSSLVFWSESSEDVHEIVCGFVVNQKLWTTIRTFKPVNNRIWMLRVRGRWHIITLFSVHAPNEDDANEEIKEKCNEILDRVTLWSYIKTVLGDLFSWLLYLFNLGDHCPWILPRLKFFHLTFPTSSTIVPLSCTQR